MRVVITGARRGIGAGLSEGYRARGAEVIGASRSEVDLADGASISAWADTVPGPVDLLVCNAGLFEDRAEALDHGYPPEMWAAQLAVNVTGVFLCVQKLLPQLRAAEAAKIAIISSQMGASVRASGTAIIYRVSKAAALNLGMNLASALRPEGIPVGIYHPGWVRTDMGGASAEISVEEARDGLMARFDDLSLTTSGCFQTWDGRDHPL
ncbi:MAG: SDR family NAD(P)-dependent oxidoreductase [Pseudomonadota bacterium]